MKDVAVAPRVTPLSNNMDIDSQSSRIVREFREEYEVPLRPHTRHPVPDEGLRTRRYRSRSPSSSTRVVRSFERESQRPDRERSRNRQEREPEGKRTIRRVDAGGKINLEIVDARELLTGRRSHSHSQRGEPATKMEQSMVRRYNEPSANDSAMLTPAVPLAPVKCTFWPNCKTGEACPFVHPSEPCKYFPTCTFGEKCLFIHPVIPCKFQQMCQNPNCNFTHSSPSFMGGAGFPGAKAAGAFVPPSTIICRFYPKCMNPSCPFVHPIDVPCKFGDQCQRPGCHFTHPENHSLTLKMKVNAPVH